MRKITAIIASLIVASALGHDHKKEEKFTVAATPNIKYYTTF